MPNESPSLNIGGHHRSKGQAERYVRELAESLGLEFPARGKRGEDRLLQLTEKSLRINFEEAIEEAQLCGVPAALQDLADARDQFLGSSPAIGLSTLPKGLSAEIAATVGEFSTSIKAPGLIEAPERSLASDILAYRRVACEASQTSNYDECTRAYRGYLQASISLIDCFLFRYAYFVRDKIGDLDQYANMKVLESRSGLEKRVEAWFQIFAFHEIKNYKETAEWAQFQELRNQRNRFVHPSEPVAGYAMRDIGRYLNYCNRGIGGLLAQFRNYTGFTENLGFIQKLKTAPEVSFTG